MSPKGKNAQAYDANPLCMFRRAPKVSHLICIAVFRGKKYYPMILKTASILIFIYILTIL